MLTDDGLSDGGRRSQWYTFGSGEIKKQVTIGSPAKNHLIDVSLV